MNSIAINYKYYLSFLMAFLPLEAMAQLETSNKTISRYSDFEVMKFYLFVIIVVIFFKSISSIIFLRKIKNNNIKRIVLSVDIINAILVPLFIFTYSLLFINEFISIGVILLFEIIFLYIINRKILSLKNVIILSLFNNLAIFVISIITLFI
jgi:hypothetical protein